MFERARTRGVVVVVRGGGSVARSVVVLVVEIDVGIVLGRADLAELAIATRRRSGRGCLRLMRRLSVAGEHARPAGYRARPRIAAPILGTPAGTCYGRAPMTTTPHDALFKAGFELPADAAGVFRHALPAAVVEAIDWSSLEGRSGSFVDHELEKRHSDLLFSATMRGKQVLLYLLLEHQSTNDADMPWRMLVYLVRIWERFRKDPEHERDPLPLILPVVVAHAPEGWTSPRSFHAMFEPDPATIPELAQLVPNFSLLIEDLHEFTNDDIKRMALEAFPTLALWALRDARDGQRFLENLAHWMHAFAELLLGPGGVDALRQLMRYVSEVSDDLALTELRAKIAQIPAADAAIMTIAEQLKNEGRAEGRAEGRELERRDMLRNLLTMKFGAIPDAFARRIETASLDDLARYAGRVLTAATIDGVFA